MLMAFNTYNLLQDCTLVKSEADADAGNFAKKDAGFAIKKVFAAYRMLTKTFG